MALVPVVSRTLDVLQRGLESRKALRAAGRDIARGLYGGGAASVREVQAGLALIARDGLDERTRGYLDALDDMIGAVRRELGSEERDRELEAAIARPVWADVMRSLAAGVHSPSALAEAQGRDRGQISRTLKEMLAARVIEPLSFGTKDGRRKTFRLTIRGQELTSKLPRRGGIEAPADAVFEASMLLMEVLAVNGRIRYADFERDLAERMEVRQATTLARRLVDEARERQIVREESGLVLLNRTLHQELASNVEEERVPPFLEELCKDLQARDIGALVVRTEGNKCDLWELIAQRVQTTRLHVLRTFDLQQGGERPQTKFAVLFDDSTVSDRDSRCDEGRRLRSQAAGLYQMDRDSLRARPLTQEVLN